MTHTPQRNRQPQYTPVAELLRMAHGRWPEILRSAGMPSDALDSRRGRPCPKCGGDDRYAPMADVAERGAVLCRSCHSQSTEPRSGDGIATLRWWLGASAADALRWLSSYLGVTDGDCPPVTSRPVERRLAIPEPVAEPERFRLMAEQWRRNMRPEYLIRSAALLGLPTEPLSRLSIGWAPEHKATTWPMRNDAGAVIGIRLRCPEMAKKWAVKGSKAGLFYDPDTMRAQIHRLFVCEGCTDTAAMLWLGCDAVGVPSAGGGGDLLASLCRRIRPGEIVLMADNDGPGLAGMSKLADSLVIIAPVRIVSPPSGIKDARAWVVGGVDRSVIESAADLAPVQSIVMEGSSNE